MVVEMILKTQPRIKGMNGAGGGGVGGGGAHKVCLTVMAI